MERGCLKKPIPKFDHLGFLIRINILLTNGCWEWSGYVEKAGYGTFTIGGSIFKAHRLSWFIFNGEIDKELVLDHICRNRKCCNPLHLRQVTGRQNTLENSLAMGAINNQKDRCIYGHPFTQKKDRRRCMTCRKETVRKSNLKRPSRAKAK